MTNSINFSIRQIFISSGHDFKGRHGKDRLHHKVETVDSVECVEGMGLKGDRFFGFKEDFKGQITFMDQAVVDELEAFIDVEDFHPSQVRRNVLVEGLDLNSLIGIEFEIAGVRFKGVEECAPCYWMDKAIGEGTESFMKGRGGLRCRILNSGELVVGSTTLSIVE